jgi:uncharacterized protein YkwD
MDISRSRQALESVRMFRCRVLSALASAIVLGSLLSACSLGGPDFNQLGQTGLAPANQDPALRSGLGLEDAKPAALADNVAPESSGKAPKGALADRDYSGARLDVEKALKLINDYRAEKGLKPLRLDPKLTIAAKMHSRDLANTDRISHYGSDGSSPWDRVKKAGYVAKIAAENVGTGQASLEEVFKGWTESPGHNRNLLLPAARDMGIALTAEPKSEFKTFWTLVVGSTS